MPGYICYYSLNNTLTSNTTVLIGFLGSFFGGVATLATVVISINETRKIQDKNDIENKEREKRNNEKELERERRRIMPFLKINDLCSWDCIINQTLIRENKWAFNFNCVLINIGKELLYDLEYNATINFEIEKWKGESFGDHLKEKYKNILLSQERCDNKDAEYIKMNMKFDKIYIPENIKIYKDKNYKYYVDKLEIEIHTNFKNYLGDKYSQKIIVKIDYDSSNGLLNKYVYEQIPKLIEQD